MRQSLTVRTSRSGARASRSWTSHRGSVECLTSLLRSRYSEVSTSRVPALLSDGLLGTGRAPGQPVERRTIDPCPPPLDRGRCASGAAARGKMAASDAGDVRGRGDDGVADRGGGGGLAGGAAGHGGVAPRRLRRPDRARRGRTAPAVRPPAALEAAARRRVGAAGPGAAPRALRRARARPAPRRARHRARRGGEGADPRPGDGTREELAFDGALLATGATPRTLPEHARPRRHLRAAHRRRRARPARAPRRPPARRGGRRRLHRFRGRGHVSRPRAAGHRARSAARAARPRPRRDAGHGVR